MPTPELPRVRFTKALPALFLGAFKRSDIICVLFETKLPRVIRGRRHAEGQ